MQQPSTIVAEHLQLSRRYFLGLGAVGLAGLTVSPLFAGDDTARSALDEAIAKIKYLTVPAKFRTVSRGKPLPSALPLVKKQAVGLMRETWKLEVIPDPESNAKLDNPLTKEKGNALDFAGLMKMAEKRSVRFLKVMTCNNIASPLGMGLWEGVPLRDVLWTAKPVENIRRVYFYGYHNDVPKQRFQGSLPIGRVLEDPPGTDPIILCYKLNGEWLSPERGGPVRMVVPEAYGFKSVKWLTTILITNQFNANDTYAGGNNDIDSHMKTFAEIVSRPFKTKVGTPLPVTGLAQVGMSGLSKVQYWLSPRDAKWPADDPYFTKAPWTDAKILGPPTEWGGGLEAGQLPENTLGIDKSGAPQTWPMRYTLAHWAALLKDVAPGEYFLRCRSIDAKGIAQPLPRPFRKSGRNTIQQMEMIVEA